MRELLTEMKTQKTALFSSGSPASSASSSNLNYPPSSSSSVVADDMEKVLYAFRYELIECV